MSNNISRIIVSYVLIGLLLFTDIAALANALRYSKFLAEIETTEAAEELEPVDEEPFVSQEIESQDEEITFRINQQFAFLGEHEYDPNQSPTDDVFTFDVSTANQGYKYVYLSFEAKGIKNPQDLPIAYNQSEVYKGEALKTSDKWQRATVQVPTAELTEGINQVRFAVPRNSGLSVEVKNVSLHYAAKAKRATINHKALRAQADLQDFKVLSESTESSTFKNKDIEMASVPKNIRNITRNSWGYGARSTENKSCRVAVGVDASKLQSPNELREAFVFYYDRTSSTWKQAHTARVDMAQQMLEANVPGNTDYFAGLIKTPDMPEASAFLPTGVSDSKAADPSAGMNLMTPPQQSKTGEASISYPLSIPAGRQGMAPSLSVTYNSDGGSGWMGIGWNLATPNISIDTRWGVPTFPSHQEEVYLINGETLVQEGGTKGNRAPVVAGSPTLSPRLTGTVRFFPQVMTSYKTIERIGDEPSEYVWVQTDAHQMKYFYGTDDGSSVNSNSVMADADGNIVQWYLTKIQDQWGNEVTYTYDKDQYASGSSMKSDGWYIVPQNINYTGFEGDAGAYDIDFFTSADRIDGTVSYRYGVKMVDDRQLDKITLSYGPTEVKNFQFEYHDPTDFYKQPLEKIKEYRSGTFFYEHTFEYHEDGDLTFANPETVAPNNLATKLIDRIIPGDMDQLKKHITNVFNPTAIKTTGTVGWSTGGGTGIGIAPIGHMATGKCYTFSGNLGYGETYTRDIRNLRDMNGDGIPDLVVDYLFGRGFHPITHGDDGMILGPFTKIHNDGRALLKSTSSSLNYGFDFSLPFNTFYYGRNWTETTNEVNNYLTDFNADGYTDLVIEDEDGTSRILFGKRNDLGELTFNTNSKTTANPILKANSLSTVDASADDLKDVELVKTWTAPFDGDVNISGLAELLPNLTGAVKVGVQHNGSFLGSGFQTVDANNSANINFTSVGVSKDDVLLFRVRADQDGQQDLITWNPRVEYVQARFFDGNDMAYTDSRYEDAFVLSGGDYQMVEDDQTFKVTLNRSVSTALTDDVEYVLSIIEYDDNLDLVGTRDFVNTLSAGSTSFSNTTFTYTPSSGPNQTLNLGGSSFLGIPNPTTDHLYGLIFSVRSTSNVDWREVKFRPAIEIALSTCEADATLYPTVDYKTYNRVEKMAAKFPSSSVTYSGSSSYRIWPEFSYSSSDIEDLFDNTSGDNEVDVYLTVKNSGSVYSRLHLVFDQTNSQLTFKTVEATPATVTSSSAPSVYKLSTPAFNDDLYVEFFVDNTAFGQNTADFILTHLSNLRLQEYDAGAWVNQASSSNNFNLFAREHSYLGDKILHWGQCAWSFQTSVSESTPINPGDLEPDFAATASDEDNQFDDENPPEPDFFDEYEDDLNPMNQQFFMLKAQRGEEDYMLRTYQIESYDDLQSNSQLSSNVQTEEENLDRYSFAGTHMAIYASAGMSSPGKLGEPEIVNSGNSNAVGNSPYTAYATKIVSKSKSHSETLNSVAFGFSETINDPSEYYSYSVLQFQDFNGDGYPDKVEDDGTDINVNFTNSLGGHAATEQLATADLSKGINISDVSITPGSFVNLNPLYSKMGSPTQNYGSSTEEIQHMDINGDGFPDRLEKSGSNITVALNQGDGFESSVQLNGYSDELHRSRNSNLSLNFNLFSLGSVDNSYDRHAGSFSAGIGVNVLGNYVGHTFVDLTGDGLNDVIVLTGLSNNQYQLDVYINKGMSFGLYSSSVPVSAMPNDVNGVGFSANASGTVAFPAFTIYVLGIDVKVSISAKGKVNFSINETGSGFMDMNGDGKVDFVDKNGGIEVSYNQMGKTNLLKTVTNPLKGSFTIDYDLVGSKVGFQEPEVKVHINSSNKVFWDMPSSKWVMSSLEVNDGYDLQDGSNDLDGEETIKVFFAYDGGLKSRRERAFLGFTRLEKKYMPSLDFANRTTSPADFETWNPGTTESKYYVTEVQQYMAPNSLEFEHLKRAPYQKNVLTETYAYLNKLTRTFTDPEYSIDHEIYPMGMNLYTYDFRNVCLDPSHANFNKLYTAGSSDAAIDWDAISETQSVFPSVATIQRLQYPDMTDATSRQKYFSQKYLLTYDDYWNVVQYEDEGELVSRDPSQRLVKTYTHTYLDYYKQLNEDLEPDESACPEYDASLSDDFYHVYMIPCDDPSYDDVTIYIPVAADPCHGLTDPLYPIGKESFDYTTVHPKEVTETVNVYAPEFNDVYQNKLIATMDYWSPGLANGQTVALKVHKIYENAVQPANLKRHTEVGSLASEIAPATIRNYLNTTQYAETSLDYDGYGNVVEIEGPEDANGERFTMSYSYDGDLNQFVTEVENSFGETSYSKYDPATDNLQKTVDVNGHAMRYVYDDMYRLSEVWAPRELYDEESAATIEFSYEIPDELDDFLPVAVTKHNYRTVISADPTLTPNDDINTLEDLSARPDLTQNVMRTATFVDGMQRVMQVKKDAAKTNSGYTANDLAQQVTGFATYDQWGEVASSSNSFLGSSSVDFDRIDEQSSAEMATQHRDYAGRVISQSHRVPQSSQFHNTEYEYNWYTHKSTEYFQTKVIANNLSTTSQLSNSRGQQRFSLQLDQNSHSLTTEFVYDLIGQLDQSIDPLGEITSYAYDNFGRVLEEEHPDRGVTSMEYDMAGNLISVTNPATGTGSINYSYDHGRLIEKTMPLTSDLYNVEYSYGTVNGGNNLVGRLKNVVQGSNFKTEHYEYDETGNLVGETKVINVPQAGVRTYLTEFAYDSWGRLLQMVYPDLEEVNYQYAATGELTGISSQHPNATPESIIDFITYDGHGNMKYMRYGNQAETEFDYDSETRSMTDVVHRTKHVLNSTIIDAVSQEFTYDGQGRIEGLEQEFDTYSIALGSGRTNTGHSYTYSYDDFNRLEGVTGDFTSVNGLSNYTDNYELNMSYNDAGGIVMKEQNISNYNVDDYTLDYTYDASKKHRIEEIEDGSDTYTYSFNGSGSIEEIELNGNVQEEFVWNEEQWLMAVENNAGYHHYIYDQNGERIMKSTLTTGSTAFSGQNTTNTAVLDPYAVYVNPFYVATAFATNDNVSKHYYMGSQRVCTEVVDYVSTTSGSGSGQTGDGGSEGEGEGGGEAPYEEGTSGHDRSSDPIEDGEQSVLGNLLSILTALEVEDAESFDISQLNKPQDINAYFDISDAEMVADGTGNGGTSATRDRYWYHPNYLGNVDMVSDEGGYVHQYFIYSPFGENLYDWSKNSDFNSPYRFNGKEEDPETGNMYYGARYYDPHISNWLSVDPMSSARGWLTPYNFVQNNPIHLVDPTGMLDGGPEGPCGSTSTNTVIMSTVNRNNETVVTYYSVFLQEESKEDGTKILNRSITKASNKVKQSDGSITKGSVQTYVQSGTEDSEGNIVWGDIQLTGQRSQGENEFKSLDSWTSYFSSWNKLNEMPYNEYQKVTGVILMDLVTASAFLPGVAASAPAATTLKQFGEKMLVAGSVSSALINLYDIFAHDSPIMLGASQSYNGQTYLQMRQPRKKPHRHSKESLSWFKWIRSLK